MAGLASRDAMRERYRGGWRHRGRFATVAFGDRITQLGAACTCRPRLWRDLA
ncbi:Uncharacterised protein [Burkholderia oklahomensis]|nr:hypothetical protein BG90_1654 [Burkholderia oklahomensis C6786]SUW58735.1 Uncharacterised protein [Burkholderia oklahomensis]